MVKIDPQRLEGNWQKGVALDIHTISSTPIGHGPSGHMQFDTKYTDLGELLNRLKYKQDQTAIADIVSTVLDFLKSYPGVVDVIVPVPPSLHRANQPVMAIASALSAALRLPLLDCVKPTRDTQSLKNVTDPEKRKELVAGLYAVAPGAVDGRNVMLFDDLYRSGTTLTAATEVLLAQGKAASVRVLTLTKTRSNR